MMLSDRFSAKAAKDNKGKTGPGISSIENQMGEKTQRSLQRSHNAAMQYHSGMPT